MGSLEMFSEQAVDKVVVILTKHVGLRTSRLSTKERVRRGLTTKECSMGV